MRPDMKPVVERAARLHPRFAPVFENAGSQVEMAGKRGPKSTLPLSNALIDRIAVGLWPIRTLPNGKVRIGGDPLNQRSTWRGQGLRRREGSRPACRAGTPE